MKDVRILSQGVMDGSCFLYAIANAYKQLICPDMLSYEFSEKMEEKWKAIIRTSPSWLCNLSGEGTDFGLKDSIENSVFLETVLRCFRIFSDDGINKRANIRMLSKSEFFKKKNYSNSVVLFCSKKGMKSNWYPYNFDYHWYCITGRAVLIDVFCVACSYVMHYGRMYDERKYVVSEKYYNNTFEISQFTKRKMFYDSFIQIELLRK